MKEYNPQKIEKKWREKWAKDKDLYKASEKSGAPKAYILDMFPYPSGEGLHVGHVESYTATDIISRYLRMKGKNVLHPQGWDAFGLPAENYAIKTKVHPSKTTQKAIANFKRQLEMMGFSYDWSREINSSNPQYYKWTQWFFLLLYKNGLAYRAEANVNWCESCQTVLANEQVENGACERCKNEVKQKKMKQWFFKITDFINDKGKTAGLISGLDKVDWPESTKVAQKNWIGKSEGAIIKFTISNFKFPNKFQNPKDQKFIEVFTTRIDTIYGCTYCVVAPEHLLIGDLKSKIENYEEVKKYAEVAKKKSELARKEGKEKTGVEIKGIKAINPFNNEEIPVFVADYVLMNYGTGAVMAVQAHDKRDWEFAWKYGLPIREVIVAEKIHPDPPLKKEGGGEAFVDDGILINSIKYNGLNSEQARNKMVEWLKENKLGGRKVNYKLRDWLISRQRYWGAQIPIIYCEKCARLRQGYGGQGEVPVPEKDLPVELPDDVDFMPTGESPLIRSKKFHNVKCPKCGNNARRESDTMDTFVCSSWYYFRYADPENKKEFASKQAIEKWLPVDLYVGGAEHTVLHLLYSRFFTKVLYNLGYIDFDEPFLKLRHQGMILAEDGRKMSKSLGNVINPDDIIERFGADCLRMYEMFMGPLEDAKQWNTNSIVGIYRFLERTYNYIFGGFTHSPFYNEKVLKQWISGELQVNTSHDLKALIHKTIKKVENDIENLKFNTAISQLMILRNEFCSVGEPESIPLPSPGRSITWYEKSQMIEKSDFEKFLIILSPFAPHLAEELWKKLGYKKSIFHEKWPEYDEELIKEENFELVVQVNGRVRDRIKVQMDISEEEARKTAISSEQVKKWTENKEIKKVVFVKNRLINFIV